MAGDRVQCWETGRPHDVTFSCNPCNQISVDSGQTAQYVYDAFNRRVWVHTNGNSAEQEPVYQEIDYDLNGKRLSVWDATPATPALLQVQLYWGSKPVAFYKGSAIHFQHQDWLGSERVTTGYNGAAESNIGHYPFGEVKSSSGNLIDAYQFGQLDHNDDNTEHAQFREYENGQGHWLAPDPYDGSYDPYNPQSFNRYSYVLNNPMAYTDPSGLDTCVVGQGGIGTEACANSGGNSANGCAYGCSDQYGNTYTAVGNGIGSVSQTSDAYDDRPGYTPQPGYNGSGYQFYGPVATSGGNGSHSGSNGNIGGGLDPDAQRIQQLATGINKGAGALNSPSTYAYWYGGSLLAASPAIFASLAELPTVAVAVGEGSPFHVAFGTEAGWLHATGPQFFNMSITSTGAAAFVRGFQYFQFNVPVLNPQAVMNTAGQAASSCVTGACYAIIQGWIK